MRRLCRGVAIFALLLVSGVGLPSSGPDPAFAESQTPPNIIFVLTGGGPGASTLSLSLLGYRYFSSGDFGYGSAVSVNMSGRCSRASRRR